MATTYTGLSLTAQRAYLQLLDAALEDEHQRDREIHSIVKQANIHID